MIKVGEWVRVKEVEFNSLRGWIDKGVKIVKIKSIDDNVSLAVINLKEKWYFQSDILGNSKPTLAELIEVGDIVHYEYFMENSNILIKNRELLICLTSDLTYLQKMSLSNKWKITAVELHENRVIQRLEENNGN